MMKASGGFGTRWMTDLSNNIVKEGCIPDDWKKSILVPVYKGKGDQLMCGSYRAIKLLEQPMKKENTHTKNTALPMATQPKVLGLTLDPKPT